MTKYIDMAMERLQSFSILDLGIFKYAVFSFGVLFGIFLGEKGKKCVPFLWITFLLSYLYLIFIIFFCKDEWEYVDDFDDIEDMEENMAN